MLKPQKFKLNREHVEEQLRLKRERLLQIKTGMQKRVIIIGFFMIIFGIPILAQRYGYITIPDTVLRIAEIFFISLAALLAASVFARLTVSKVFQMLESEVEVEQNIILTKLYTSFIYLVAFGVILWEIGVSAESITLYLGFLTTAIALATRDLIVSFFVWFIVLEKKPFRIGDVIKIGDDTGVVTRIGTFFITIESVIDPKETVKIPNNLVLQKTFLNMGRDRMYQEIEIALSSLPDDIDSRMEQIKEHVKSILGPTESMSVEIDASKDGWYLKVKMVIRPENEHKKSDILKAAYPVIKDILKK